MYRRAKTDGINFQNFHEWINHDINKTMYSIDLQFFDLEAKWLQRAQDCKKYDKFAMDFQRFQQEALQEIENEQKAYM